MEDNLIIPKHIAIIMDGNGRWAKKKKRPRLFGHKAGAENLEKLTRYASDIGVKYLTVFAFSTENWKRPEDEVSGIMNLLRYYIDKKIEEAQRNNLKICIIGDTSRLSKDLQEKINDIQNLTKNNTGICIQIALNYGGRDELVRAVRKIVTDVEKNKLDINSINENCISAYLDTAGTPEIDLLIRTSGELRISNFLLWQLAYTEFYFTDVLWPDFNNECLLDAIYYFNKRERRYGGI